MTFKYRLKTYQNEEGEYSEYLPATRELILVMIAMHWTNETMPNNLEIISIVNMDGQSLLLEHSNKHVFEVYFLPKEKGFHFHKKSNIDLVLDTLDLFFKGKIQEVQAMLNETRKDDKYIRGEFFFIDHNYHYDSDRARRAITWVFLPMVMLLPMIYPLYSSTSSEGLMFWILFGGIIVGVFILPGVYLHFSYIDDIKGWTIRVTRGSDKIMVRSPTKTKEFSKNDILQVTKCSVPMGSKSMWSEYGYLEIEFNTGEIVNISNLICNQFYVLEKFPEGVKRLKQESWLPTLRCPTSIN